MASRVSLSHCMFLFLCLLNVLAEITAYDSNYYQYFIKDAAERRATCNDGTPPTYYVRLSDVSTDWLFYLEGGGGCYDDQSCKERMATAPVLMTSHGLPSSMQGLGILSPNCSENPAFCKANAVYIHYCSSDWWAGNHTSDESGTAFAFLGRSIVPAIIEDLLDGSKNSTIQTAFAQATRVVLSGSSAGGVGVFQHADSLASLLRSALPKGSSLSFGAVPDCGWFLPGPGLDSYPCTTNELCNVETRFRVGARMWGLSPQSTCATSKGPRAWRCLFGNEVYPFVQSKIFPMFFLTDFWQAWQDGIDISAPLTETEKSWLLGRELQSRLSIAEDRVESVLAISCYYHGILPFNIYHTMTVGGMTLADALQRWLDNGMTGVRLIDSCVGVSCNPTCPTTP